MQVEEILDLTVDETLEIMVQYTHAYADYDGLRIWLMRGTVG